VRKNLFWLSDEQWGRIEPHLPTDVRGVERADDRRVISGIVHVLKSGCRWCDCPPEYPRRPNSTTAAKCSSGQSENRCIRLVALIHRDPRKEGVLHVNDRMGAVIEPRDRKLRCNDVFQDENERQHIERDASGTRPGLR
jgi:hypothetical protein